MHASVPAFDRDDIEAGGAAEHTVARQESRTRARQPRCLRASTASSGSIGDVAQLYLDEHDRVAVERHQVDLADAASASCARGSRSPRVSRCSAARLRRACRAVAAVARARIRSLARSFRHGDGLARSARAGQCRRRHDRDEPPQPRRKPALRHGNRRVKSAGCDAALARRSTARRRLGAARALSDDEIERLRQDLSSYPRLRRQARRARHGKRRADLARGRDAARRSATTP